MPVPDGARLAGGGRPAGGLHDRPRRALHAGASCARASACSCTAAPAASAPPRSSSRAPTGARVTATVRSERAARRRSASSAPSAIAPEGFAEHGPFDVILELVGAPNLRGEPAGARDRRAHRGDRRLGAGAKAELNLLALMGKRARIHGSTLRARPLEEKALAARALEREVLPLFDARRAARAGRRDLPAGARPPRPTSASPPAASSARSCSRSDRRDGRGRLR